MVNSSPNPISNFRGEYFFLSNFYPVTIILDGRIYPSVEHAYQASKTFDCMHRRAIQFAETPAIARRLGRSVDLRPDWTDSVKISVMRSLLEQKFADPYLKSLLKFTGQAEIVEGNTWGDTFWGVCKSVGSNHLGRLLMEIRNGL